MCMESPSSTNGPVMSEAMAELQRRLESLPLDDAVR